MIPVTWFQQGTHPSRQGTGGTYFGPESGFIDADSNPDPACSKIFRVRNAWLRIPQCFKALANLSSIFWGNFVSNFYAVKKVAFSILLREKCVGTNSTSLKLF